LRLDDIQLSGKLRALQQLFQECGLGASSAASSDDDLLEEAPTGQHRCLLFAQSKAMLDLVQEHLIKGSGISSLRLDGSTPTQQRQLIADQFNQDPTIDILLLTTSVGGLGLTLTGADTVIFLEHDWNPSKDMQAMDRARRLGQKKTVHVYRLITQDTLEEKIMSLQQFKKNVSNAVISADNKSIGSMGTDQLLDLFQAPDPANPAGNVQTVRVIVCCACFTVGSTFSLVSAWLFFMAVARVLRGGTVKPHVPAPVLISFLACVLFGCVAGRLGSGVTKGSHADGRGGLGRVPVRRRV